MAEGLCRLIGSLRAAAEPTRMRLLAICSEGELTVSEITHIVGQSQPRVSRHLKLLCNAGLLIRFREGHFVLYRVPATGEGAAMVQLLLSQLSRDDEQLELDCARMDSVKAERARLAADFLRFSNEDLARLREEKAGDADINNIVVDMLDAERIGDLLDIGTGTGRILQLLGQIASSAVGIDTSPEMLAVARSNLHAAGLGRVMVRRGNIYGLPFPDASFDTVTVDHVLSHATHPRRAIREAARVLRSNGQILVVECASHDDHESGAHGINNEDLERWFDGAGLRSVQLRELNGGALLTVAVPARRQRIVAA